MAEMRSVSDGKDADVTRLFIQRADCDAIRIRLLADIVAEFSNQEFFVVFKPGIFHF